MHAQHEHHETHYSYAQDRRENFSLPFAAADLAKELKEVNHITFGDTDIKMTKGGRERFEDPTTGEKVERDVYVVKIKRGKTEAHIALIESADGAGTRFDMLDTDITEHNHVAGISRWDKSYDGVYRKLPVDYAVNLTDSDLDPNAIQELFASLKQTVTSATEKLEKGYGYTDADPKTKAKLLAVGAAAIVLSACGSAGLQPPIPTLNPTEQAEIHAARVADRLQKESDMAVKHAAEGTPVAPEKWKPLYEVAQKNTVEMHLGEANFSGTLVNGSVVGRPDMGIIVTTKHGLYDLKAYAKRTGALGIELPNQLAEQLNLHEKDYGLSYPKGVKGEVNEADTYDYGIIVFPLSLSDKLQQIFGHAITNVDETFTGDKPIMAAGFPYMYDEQLSLLDPEGAKQPLVEVANPIQNKPEDTMYGYDSAQHPAGYGPQASGGGIYNESGALCGVIKGYNTDPGMEKRFNISPLRDFKDVVNEALADYEGKKG